MSVEQQNRNPCQDMPRAICTRIPQKQLSKRIVEDQQTQQCTNNQQQYIRDLIITNRHSNRHEAKCNHNRHADRQSI